MQPKKKVDYIALSSPFMRIPRMNVRAARALLDMGIKEIFELKGRDPNSLLADYSKIKKPDGDLLKFFTLAVDFADND
ncbi:MAG: hypothetical protein J6B07_01055 [Opitutales bacterium]|nr:hypothetical protein [Opitutales bacterium]